MRLNIALGLFAILSASVMAEDQISSTTTSLTTSAAAETPTTTLATLTRPSGAETSSISTTTRKWYPKKRPGHHSGKKCSCKKQNGRKGRKGRQGRQGRKHRGRIGKGKGKGHGSKPFGQKLCWGTNKNCLKVNYSRPQSGPGPRPRPLMRPTPSRPWNPYPFGPSYVQPHYNYNPWTPVGPSHLYPRQLKVSTDGTCGNGVTCAGNPEGTCCSQYGFCGKSEAYCGTGCQAAFGTCLGGGAGPAPPAGPPAGPPVGPPAPPPTTDKPGETETGSETGAETGTEAGAETQAEGNEAADTAEGTDE